MKKQQLNEIKRIQKLAGLLTENEENYKNNKMLEAQKQRVLEWYKMTEVEDEELEAEIHDYLNEIIGEYITRGEFKDIWGMFLEKYSEGDHGMDWDAFDETYIWIKTGYESAFNNY